MDTKLSQLQRLKEFKRENKMYLKALYESFLTSEYRGHTYSDFVLIKWVEMRKNMVYFDRIKILNIICDKVNLQLSNLDFRIKLKSSKLPEWRRPHYQALIGHQREMINKYNYLIFTILGGGKPS